MGTMFWFVSSGLLLSAVANRNVTTDVSHTRARAHARTYEHQVRVMLYV